MRWHHVSFVIALASGASSFSLDGDHYLHRLEARDPAHAQTTPKAMVRRHHLSEREVDDRHYALEKRQTVTACGPSNGNQICQGGQCCSEFGYCGTGDQYCASIVGCMPQYGSCEGSAGPSPGPSTPAPQPTEPSQPPTQPSSPVRPGPSPPAGMTISRTGFCGNSTTCAGSVFGDCCSHFFYCGSGAAYCGSGCQPQYGTCGAITTPSPISTARPLPPPPSSTYRPPVSSTSSAPAAVASNVSKDGTCGNGITCAGSTFGDCCSRYGFCGTGFLYCAVADLCQSAWGSCSQIPTPATRRV